jgi:hypothetical protein
MERLNPSILASEYRNDQNRSALDDVSSASVHRGLLRPMLVQVASIVSGCQVYRLQREYSLVGGHILFAPYLLFKPNEVRNSKNLG